MAKKIFGSNGVPFLPFSHGSHDGNHHMLDLQSGKGISALSMSHDLRLSSCAKHLGFGSHD
jgi:hypothetical protein